MKRYGIPDILEFIYKGLLGEQVHTEIYMDIIYAHAHKRGDSAIGCARCAKVNDIWS